MATVVNIGDIKIVAVTDGEAAPINPGWPFPSVPSSSWGDARFALDHEGRHLSNFGAFVIRSRGATVLVDTGLGPGSWEVQAPGADAGHLVESLSKAGISPGSITCVVLTHLHFDHVGWNVTSSESDSPNPCVPQGEIFGPRSRLAPLARQHRPSQRPSPEGVPGQRSAVTRIGRPRIRCRGDLGRARRTDFTYPRPYAGPSVVATGIRSGTRDRDRRCVPFVGAVHISGLVSPGRYRPGNGPKIEGRVTREVAA